MAKRLTEEEKKQKKAEEARKKSLLVAEFQHRKKELGRAVVRDIVILTMHDKVINASDIISTWKGDRQMVAEYLQNFLYYNHDALSILGVEYEMSTTEIALVLKASQLVGCAPLISPVTGKQCGNIIVKSDYQDDIDGIIPLINGDIDLRYNESLLLNKSPLVHPPLYLESIRFIEEIQNFDKKQWKKFANFYAEQKTPTSSTDWGKYALRSYDPNMMLRYPNRINRLISEHSEWVELMYVLSIAIAEIQSNSTPATVKQTYQITISQLKQTIPYQSLKPIRELKIHKADPMSVQTLKHIGNNILKHESTAACAWSFNITKLFERYVQYVLGAVMNKLGGVVLCNNKYPIKGDLPKWSLSYLEPDVLLKYHNTMVVVDAKYKSHMMNLGSNTDALKSSFRHDLHQVLAYSSLSNMKHKTIMFCYPCTSVTHRTMTLSSPYNGAETEIIVCGMPINKECIPDIIYYIFNLLNKKTKGDLR